MADTTESNVVATDADAATVLGTATTVAEPAVEAAKTVEQASDDLLGEAGKAALVAEREARKEAERTLKATAARLQEFEDKDKSELERKDSTIAAITQERDEATSALLRYEVAAEKGIPADALPLLSGSSREELEAKADSILTLIAKKPSGPVVPNEGTAPDTGSTADHIARQILLG